MNILISSGKNKVKLIVAGRGYFRYTRFSYMILLNLCNPRIVICIL